MDDYSRPPMNQPSMTPPHRQGRASFLALFLIVAGVLMFLDNLGFIPNIRPYWPLAIVVHGTWQLLRPNRPCPSVIALFEVAAGVLLTLGNLGFLHFSIGSLWPLFLIALGLSMLFGRKGRPNRWNHHWGNNFTAPAFVGGRFDGNILRENAAFSSVNRRVESTTFEGADLNATFGELKIDLRAATISTPNREAIIETNASFGAIKLRIPETWRVLVQGGAAFGAFEDRTVPPRPEPGVEPPTVIIRGNATFGSVEIDN
jgi:predicted membrane protein